MKFGCFGLVILNIISRKSNNHLFFIQNYWLLSGEKKKYTQRKNSKKITKTQLYSYFQKKQIKILVVFKHI